MDGSRPLKRPSDGEPSESSKRQHIEGHASGSSSQLERLRRALLLTGDQTSLSSSRATETA